ncbi:MAG: putative holin-like toxin [Tepidanaerobacteraceae bacterium]
MNTNYDIIYLGNRISRVRLPPHSLKEGGGAMSTYESLSLMIMFSMLIIAVLKFGTKK